MEEVIPVRFNNTKPDTKMSELDESFANLRLNEDIGPLVEQSTGTNVSDQVKGQPQEEREPTGQILSKNHLESQIIGDPSTKVQTRGSLRQQGFITLILEVETKHINDAMEDKNWVKAMQEELEKFKKNDIWKLVELPQENKVVRAKWVFRNKLGE